MHFYSSASVFVVALLSVTIGGDTVRDATQIPQVGKRAANIRKYILLNLKIKIAKSCLKYNLNIGHI